ncbi:MAG: hypothetical protein V7542_01440 [Limnobacter sp.]|jgi:hypothetical protein|uniref:hypothetical protein n=1 Tax=unclassified Limnobacter TaxID=2630203 RepID=UPI000C4CD999|nr:MULTISPECIES: hypothetical protein [unclassified Limnobacter]MAZ10647.1 hypothetical protein [Sutterellaceae bacterium]PZO16036.1 MAG: hypothetical protein DCE87_07510 [Betaproteobacteria bacterium]MDP3270995.1 hypothetical protein [Limnobacter sp.]MDZ4048887.1 hypothetical protein [Limnobacter sp.]PQJ24811.1 hypothetical protein BSZ31_07370 [Limnobacter sp. SAORIC-690]|tara:strand:- start:6822 stop:7223 length:402 start_codon:yes stop_codon:yes gene_type:complete
MKKTLFCACLVLTPLLAPTLASAQAGGVTLNIDGQNPLSKWGRWTSSENGGLGYGFRLNQDRNKAPMSAQWGTGDWVFKLSREEGNKYPDLFFGLKVSENQLQTTSLGCMSNSGSATRYSSTLCGVQLDMNLQ